MTAWKYGGERQISEEEMARMNVCPSCWHSWDQHRQSGCECGCVWTAPPGIEN